VFVNRVAWAIVALLRERAVKKVRTVPGKAQLKSTRVYVVTDYGRELLNSSTR
jgi:hypothetical protein